MAVIKWILCTHTHLDHSPAAAKLKAATGAKVLGRPAPAGQDATFAPDRTGADGDRLFLGGIVLRAIHTPGHASNHLCYLLEDSRMLFTGDHVMQGSTVVINPPDGDMRAYLASLERLLAEDLAIIAPGPRLPDRRAAPGAAPPDRAPPGAREEGASTRSAGCARRRSRSCCRWSTTTCRRASTARRRARSPRTSTSWSPTARCAPTAAATRWYNEPSRRNRAMSIHDKTLKLVTNLDRAAIEARLADVRKAAQAANLADVVGALAGIRGRGPPGRWSRRCAPPTRLSPPRRSTRGSPRSSSW